MPPEKEKEKKSTLKTIFTPVMLCGCGCSPNRPTPYSASSKHKPEERRTSISKTMSPLLSPSSRGHNNASPLYSVGAGHDIGSLVSPRLLRSPCPGIDESMAMAKESVNPFEDFRASIKQMIEEREIEREDDLKELLRCFLDINTPLHHNVIVRAFVDVCSTFKPPQDRHGRSLGRLLRLYVNPVDESHKAPL